MGLPNVEELDHCPITPECAARKLYRTEGKIYKYDNQSHKFKEHVCSTAGTESRLAETLFTSQWLNRRTKRTRYNGPHRLEKSAMNPPPDSGNDKRNKASRVEEWEFVAMHIAKPTWEVKK